MDTLATIAYGLLPFLVLALGLILVMGAAYSVAYVRTHTKIATIELSADEKQFARATIMELAHWAEETIPVGKERLSAVVDHAVHLLGLGPIEAKRITHSVLPELGYGKAIKKASGPDA